MMYECNLSVFDRGMIVDDKKHPVSGSFAYGNALLMREVRGKWADWLELTERLW